MKTGTKQKIRRKKKEKETEIPKNQADNVLKNTPRTFDFDRNGY